MWRKVTDRELLEEETGARITLEYENMYVVRLHKAGEKLRTLRKFLVRETAEKYFKKLIEEVCGR